MKNSLFFLAIVAWLAISSCSPKVYHSTDSEILTRSHQVIAILPPRVSIPVHKKADPADVKAQEAVESHNFQKEMYSWILHRKMQNRILVDIQDIETTRALLITAGYYDDPTLRPTEISEILGVDAVITSNFALTKPMSEIGAVALRLIFDGPWRNTNRTTVTMAIHDRANEKTIWNYHHIARGTVGSTPALLVHQLMRNASRKMPYSG